MTLADRLNKIIAEQNISKREFAKRIGVSENYVYTLTGESKKSLLFLPPLQKSSPLNLVVMQSGCYTEIKNK